MFVHFVEALAENLFFADQLFINVAFRSRQEIIRGLDITIWRQIVQKDHFTEVLKLRKQLEGLLVGHEIGEYEHNMKQFPYLLNCLLEAGRLIWNSNLLQLFNVQCFNLCQLSLEIFIKENALVHPHN